MKATTSLLILLSSLVAVSGFTTTTDITLSLSLQRPSFISKSLTAQVVASSATACHASLTTCSYSFSRNRQQQKQHRRATSRRSSRLSASSKDDEIAKLEEQLRQLRNDAPADDTSTVVAAESSKSEKEIIAVQRILKKVKGKDMLLTEQQLVDQDLFLNQGFDDEASGSPLPAVLAALGAAVFLFFFSQIPVGQDEWGRYSTTSGPTTSTRIDLGDMNSDAK
jgi:hypothetical protein